DRDELRDGGSFVVAADAGLRRPDALDHPVGMALDGDRERRAGTASCRRPDAAEHLVAITRGEQQTRLDQCPDLIFYAVTIRRDRSRRFEVEGGLEHGQLDQGPPRRLIEEVEAPPDN